MMTVVIVTSQDNREDVHDEPIQMGVGVMNSDYKSEELHGIDAQYR